MGFWLTLASILLAGVSLILRYRCAGGPERQQLKWFASAAALFAATSIVYTVFLAGVAEQAGQSPPSWLSPPSPSPSVWPSCVIGSTTST